MSIKYAENCRLEIENLSSSNINSESLYFIILNPFDYKDFVAICDRLKALNTYVTICFAYNSMFYISNLYKNEWYNPCPKCYFAHLETSLRSKSKISTKATFQTIVDLIYNKECSFQVCLPTTKKNILPLITEIMLYSKNDLNYLANRVAKVELMGEVTYDQCNHWELCDCFE